MITIPVASISPTAGELADGFFIGGINKSNPAAVLIADSLVPLAQVLRKAVTASGAVWEDFTTRATDAATGDFAPFGAAGDMSVGDSIYFRVADGVSCNRIHVQIATPGAGTWTIELQEWDESTDTWVPVGSFVDASNGLQAAAGVYEIKFSHAKSGKVRLDDSSSKYVWHRLYLKTFGSATTAPVLSRMWAVATSVENYRNVTQAFISDPDDFSSLPAEILPRVGEGIITVHPDITIGEDIVVTRSASSNYTTAMYYWANDNTWKLLAGVTDESTGLRVAASTTERKRRWTTPSDWASKSFVDTASVTHTGYATKLNIESVTTQGVVLPPQAQSKSRSFGDANTSGIVLLSATTIKGVSLPRVGVPSTSAQNVSLHNLSQKKSVSFTIPANANLLNVDTDDLAFLVNEKFAASCSSGGELKDTSLMLQS